MPYMARQRMCQVVVNIQLTAGGHYHDVKYPSAFTQLDTLPPYLLLSKQTWLTWDMTILFTV